ncbi:MAG TPA: response regulator [Beijerinckiaceae bacterium]|jgi:CheY-like chemotaxis protein
MNPHHDVVLVVEDDPDDRHLIARAFRKAQVQVPIHFADDGEQAVAFLSGAAADPAAMRPAVVLLDLKLPRRSGFEVLTWVKAHESLKRIPIVVLTSSRESSDLQRAYDLGANSYLVKPAKPDALLQMVATIDAYWLRLNEAAGARLG